MKSLGIIAEFHPFHQGHGYLIEEAKKMTGADLTVAVISGDFMQRGTPAAIDKWERAKVAVENGVNLVLELPAVFVCSSAEHFAKRGVEILEGLGALDYIAFGSESGDIAALQKTAKQLQDREEELHDRIAPLIKEGMSYPRARQLAAEAIFADEEIRRHLSQPNNILAVEYLKQIRNLTPVTVKRKGDGYHKSASAIRREMEEKDPQRFQMMRDNYLRLVSAEILKADTGKLGQLYSAGEGLGAKLKKEIRYAANLDELIGRMKSKGYTYSRICRLLTQALLCIDRDAVENARNYIRILALDEKGGAFLKEIKNAERARLPIITNINKEAYRYPEIEKTLAVDILASDLYNLIAGNNLYACSDYVKGPYFQGGTNL